MKVTVEDQDDGSSPLIGEPPRRTGRVDKLRVWSGLADGRPGE